MSPEFQVLCRPCKRMVPEGEWVKQHRTHLRMAALPKVAEATAEEDGHLLPAEADE